MQVPGRLSWNWWRKRCLYSSSRSVRSLSPESTCISKVYERTLPEFHEVIDRARAKTAEYAASLSTPAADTVSLYNTLSFDRDTIATFDGEVRFDNALTQSYTDADGATKTAAAVHLPAMSACVLQKTDATDAPAAFRREGNVLTTPYYRVTLDEDGYISSLYDVEADRELRRDGGAPLGTLWLGEDMPRDWDNWDIDDDALPIMRPVTSPISCEVVSDGALAYRIRTTYRLTRRSTATVDTVFYATTRRIDYEVKLDWNERHTLLKAGFDLAIRSTTVRNEIQFGHIDRPTTRNTPHESCKFEICNHKWSDLSETRYGVSLINSGKYGLSCQGSDMRLTLKTGGVRPDPVTDCGIQYMSYALLPHVGGFDAETVIRPAYDFNYKPVEIAGEASIPALFTLSAPGVICEAVKAAEDIPGAYVLRLYEAERNGTACVLNVPGATRVVEANMLEEPVAELPMDGETVKLHFRPFEIKTVLVYR